MTEGRHLPTVPPDILGAVLGNYRIIAELSSGGMGTVYRARHELLGRPAAVKLLRPDLTLNDELVQRFFNEAKAATAIDHPGIIEVFDFGYTEDGRAYLVMEFLDGQPLSRRVEERGRLGEVEATQIARGIASALTAAHDKGIVHRDLKPDNVFLVPDPDVPGGERPKVLDFGIAKLAEPAGLAAAGVRHTVTGTLMGTPLYMAPEQARAAGAIDHRADLYSLGCILYELLVGQPPFVAPGAGEIIALQLFGTVTPPGERVPGISPELEAIVMKLLEKEPAARYQRATEVVDELGALLGEAPRTTSGYTTGPARIAKLVTRNSRLTPMPSALEVVPARPRRVRLPLVLAGVAALCAAAAAIVVATHHGEAPTRPAPVVAPAPPPAPPAVKVETPMVEAQAPPPAPPPAPPRPVVRRKRADGAHTSKGAPIETTLGP
ncbi:MAG: serine/threonine-protein kinase [Acidobacteriota bacterium]